MNKEKLNKNQIIAESNKEAFMKFTPTEFNEEKVEDIDDIVDNKDFRNNKDKRGVVINCYYCGDCIRVDGEGEDYPDVDELIHCESCMKDAIAKLAM